MSTELARYRTQILSAMGLASMALAGCDAEPGALPDDLAPPPLALSGGPALTGTASSWSIDGGTPGETIWLVAGPALGAGPCPALLGGLCVDIVRSQILGSATADAVGHADIEILLPSVIEDGTPIHLQALQGGTSPGVSGVITELADHLPRTCGEYPEPDPNNYWMFNTFMLCGPIPSSGSCPTYSTLPYNGVQRTFARKAGIPQSQAWLFDVWPTCDEVSVEDRCCYSVDVSQIAIGRPFTVEGTARLATQGRDPSWSAELSLDPSGLPRALRRRLAALWTHTAHGEHASVASFARFQLHLMQLGAPADLVAETTRAMADEIRHAREAFAVASALAGEARGPGPLDTTGALEHVDLREAVLAAVREGCIAETLAAAQVAEAARRCTVPGLREILAATAEDEQRHAQLAWRFVRWALGAHPELRDAIAQAFAEGVGLSGLPADADAHTLAAWGMLDSASADAVAAEVFHTVVRPCAQALLAGPVVAEA